MEEIQDWEKWVETKIKKWETYNLTDKDLWNQYLDDFDEWTEKDFKSDVSHTLLRRLRDTLRRRGVWVSRDEKITIEKALYNTLQEKNPPKWTETEVLKCLPYENFISITIKILLKTNFGRKPPPPVPPRPVSPPRSVSSPPSEILSPPPPPPSPRQAYSPLPPRPPTPVQKEKQPGGQPGGQSGEQPGEQSDEQSVKPPDGSSVKPSTGPPSDGSSVKPPDGSSVKPPVESSDGPSVEPSVERPFKPPYD
jgi:hypothetical protein